MGTSTTNIGPNSKNPLIPSWLDSEGESLPQNGNAGESGNQQDDVTQENPKSPIQPQQGQRFRYPRAKINEYLRTGNSNSMKKGVSNYVKGSGGSKAALKRMGNAPVAAGNLASFLNGVSHNGLDVVAQEYSIQLRGDETADELLLRVSDQICGETSGDLPDSVIRNAYTDTISEMLTTLGITDLENTTSEQIQASLGCFVGKSVSYRIINDICNNLVAHKATPEKLSETISELSGYIEGRAYDAVNDINANGFDLTDQKLIECMENIYTDVFEILASVEDE
ncbi:Qat anti-phage system associated protein QatB [Colwellia ponticola]|uniref:Uncharacterized protein n=1 Tax=Colwellia ponticola TaxID=2304625 RepID=A0A8H2JMA0_9GAMM|nr:Qat anti-phage system associated protein QatB [Colwellia ponticola]TMM45727.1 hypothetical protein FCS21_07860 [Colwellia ponticola]